MADGDAAYFQYYAQVAHQQNMLMDAVRTSAYYDAITGNSEHFKGKIVMDVGCGSGVLGFFALLAGAKHVYAVDAAKPILNVARRLAEANGLEDRMTFLEGKVEDIDDIAGLRVDIIVSEPIGILLLHERMCESFAHARDRFLEAGGKLFPHSGTIKLGLFTDPGLYAETVQKGAFWANRNFFGLDLRVIQEDAVRAAFAQPVVGGFDRRTLLNGSDIEHEIDFERCAVEQLRRVHIPIVAEASHTGVIHGVAGWFDLGFHGGTSLVTAPEAERTHWHQVRFLLQHPLAINRGELVRGSFEMTANAHRSFDVRLVLQTPGAEVRGEWSLQDHYYGNLGPVVESEFLPLYS